MPTQDELLLQFSQKGAEDVAGGANTVADNLDKVSNSETKLNKAASESTGSIKEHVRGLADLKAGLDIVSNVGGKVVNFLKDATEETVKYAAEVRDLSRSIGANAEETSALIQVADDVTVSTGTLEAAFKAAIKNGIQPSIENLAKLSDEYRAIQDPVQRSQFAMDKFGRAGLEMAKILEQGGDAIRESAKAAKEMGLTLSDDAVQSARDFEIGMDNLGDRVDALKTKIGTGLLPVVNKFFETMDKGLQTLDLITNGSQNLSDTFSTVAAKMQVDVVSGKMSLDDYNAAITGMAQNVARWDAATGASLQNQFLLTQSQQQVMTSFYNTTGAMTTQGLVEKNNAAIAATAAEADRIRGEQMKPVNDAIAARYQAMGNAILQEQAYNAALIESEKAQVTYRAGVSETVGRIDALAKSLANARNEQATQILAQASLETITKAYKDGTITQAEYQNAVDKVLLKYDMATPKSLAISKAQETINKAFLDGKISLDDYVLVADKLPKLADDGKVSTEELAKLGVEVLGEKAKITRGHMSDLTTQVHDTGGEVDKAKDKTNDYISRLNAIPPKIETEIIWKNVVIGEPPTGRASGGPVSAGVPYMVGERGPEMFVPSQNGNIVSNQTNNYKTDYNITTDRTGLAFIFERQRMAEGRM